MIRELVARFRAPVARPPVSAVVRVTPFDVPYLAVMLAHVLRQTRYTFSERVVVIDEQGTRPWGTRGDRGELDYILADAMRDGLIDRVVTTDGTEEQRRAIHRRYFGSAMPGRHGADRPIFALLVALEAARHDVIAWIDIDVLFHASGSWVGEGVDAIVRDDDVWFASTHGGPLQSTVAQLQRTLVPRRRFEPAGHFVCDRRRLVGRLRWVGDSRDRSSAFLSDALSRYGAMVRTVGGGWHLRTNCHERPFTHWAPQIIATVERGSLPAIQTGAWIALGNAGARSAWRHHLFGDAVVEDTPRPTAQIVTRTQVPDGARISVIVPIRDRAGSDVRNSLASLAWQSKRPFEIIVVSHGSDPAIDAELRVLVEQVGATLVTVGTPADPWCKPLALNTGIRATDPSVPFVMTMDADMILADTMLETITDELARDPQQILLCQSSDLPEGTQLPDDTDEIRARFAQLRSLATVRPEFGTGGIQAMPRRFVFEVRGYDEDMLWWGALDTDLVRRAEARGLRTTWITQRSAMLHQWHPRKHRILDGGDVDAAQESWLRNHELMLERAKQVVRNHGGWGADLLRLDSRSVTRDRPE